MKNAKAETKINPADLPGKIEVVENSTAVQPRKVQQLIRNRMAECEFKRTLYVATAHENTEPGDLMDPAYWANVAADLKPWDKIEARADDGSWYAEFLVLETSRAWARVHMLNHADLTTVDVSLTQSKFGEYDIAYKGPERMWSVIRISDNQVLHEGEQMKAGAYAWLSNQIKAGI